jgi:hypothetical protein
VFEGLQILLSFKATAIDANIKVEFYNLLDLFYPPSKRVHNSSCKSVSILPHDVIEIRASVTIVQVHGQLEFLCQIEMEREDLQLLLFRSIVQSIVI